MLVLPICAATFVRVRLGSGSVETPNAPWAPVPEPPAYPHVKVLPLLGTTVSAAHPITPDLQPLSVHTQMAQNEATWVESTTSTLVHGVAPYEQALRIQSRAA